MSDTDYVAVPRVVAEMIVDDFGDLIASTLTKSLRTALDGPVITFGREVSPPWGKVRNMAAQLERLLDERGVRALHELDQLRATIRDQFDDLEVSLHDEWVLYHGLCWVGMVVELARNGHANGYIAHDTYQAIAEIGTSIAAGLVEYLPPEARP